MAEEPEEDEGGGGSELPPDPLPATGAPEWVVTFGDMMSLLLTFFILLLSFSSTDSVRFKQMAGAIKEGFGTFGKERVIELDRAEDFVKSDTKIDYNSHKILETLKRRLIPRIHTRYSSRVNVEIFETYRGVVVLFSAADFFVEGTAQLKEDAIPLLDLVADEALEQPNELALEVRVPDKSPMAPEYSDSWELSTYQAVTLGQHMRRKGLSGVRMNPVGRGPTEPDRPVGAPKASPRPTVEFVFLSRNIKPE